MKVAHLSEPAEERVIFRDGLGVRERRETSTGEVVEWFHLDPAFASAEIPLRERVTRLAKLQHVKFARILSLEPSTKGRGPILVSSHTPGVRMADALEMAGHGLIQFEPGVGLHVFREVLGALAVLHDSRNVSHGALGPERVILTPNGRVVMVEHVLAQALDRLQRPRHQLWREWRIPTPPAAGQARFDMQTDLAQAGLLAFALLLGRPLNEEEYPHRLRGLLPLVQDRLGRSSASAIAADVTAFIERLAPLDSRRAFKGVREAQQAYEKLITGAATSMGATSARAKTVHAAVVAIGPAGTAAVAAATPHTATAEAATPLTVSSAKAAAPAPRSQEPAEPEPEIDIEALLALEAELEGGTAVPPDLPAAPPPVQVAATALTEDAPATLDEPEAVADAAVDAPPADAPALDVIAQERADLERQFAELVASVAPAEDAPVHLIPETPDTSEPLVDARVLWSSMPAADAADTAAPLDEPVTPWLPEPLSVPVVEAGAESPVPFADTSIFAQLDGSHADNTIEAAAQESVPSAAIEHVPAEWWKEALPWRDESQPSAAEAESSFALESTSIPGVAADAAATVEEPAPAGVGEDFGYLSLDTIDAQADAVALSEDSERPIDIEPATSTDALVAPEVVDVSEAPDAETAAAPLQAADEPAALIEADAVPETADAAATVAEIELLLEDESLIDDVTLAVDDHDVPVAASMEAPPSVIAFIAPDEPSVATEALAETAAAAVDAPLEYEEVSIGGAEAMAPSGVSRPFGDIEPILLQGDDDEDMSAVSSFGFQPVDDAPLAAAASLFAHEAGGDGSHDWRTAFLGAAVEAVPTTDDFFGDASSQPSILEATDGSSGEDDLAADVVLESPAVAEAEWLLVPAVEDMPAGESMYVEEVAFVEEETPAGEAPVLEALEVVEAIPCEEPVVVADSAPMEETELVAAPAASAEIEFDELLVGPVGGSDADAEGVVAVEVEGEVDGRAGSPSPALSPDSELALVAESAPAVESAQNEAPDVVEDAVSINEAPFHVEPEAVEIVAEEEPALVGEVVAESDETVDAIAEVVPVDEPLLHDEAELALEPLVEVAVVEDVPALEAREEIVVLETADALVDELALDDEPEPTCEPVAEVVADDIPTLDVESDETQEAIAAVASDEAPAFEPFEEDISAQTADAIAESAPVEELVLHDEPDLAFEPIADAVAVEESASEVESAQTVEAIAWLAVDDAPASEPFTEVVVAEDPALVAEPAPVSEPAPAEAPAPAPVAEPAPEVMPAPAFEPPGDVSRPIEVPAMMPEHVPEVVIVDDGHHRDAWDHLPIEGRARAAAAAAAAAAKQTAATSKKKRRRAKRKKGGAEVVPPPVMIPAVVPAVVAPVVAAPPAAAPVPVAPAMMPRPEVATSTPLTVSPMALSLTPSAPATTADSDARGARPTSLLNREVPAWTPPSDLADMRPRPATPAPVETASAVAAADDQDVDVPPAAMMAPGEFAAPHVPARPVLVASSSVPDPGASSATRGVGPQGALPVLSAPDALRPFEHEIRAVGMPDMDDLQPRTGRATFTSMADSIGPSQASGRVQTTDSWAPPPMSTAGARRGINWRRFIAASVLIALFQGAAFAAWWWVQPGVRGTLVVQTGKTGVEVLLDDKVVGRTPFREDVAPGRHKLKLRAGGNVREMPVEISVGVVTTQAIDWPSSGAGTGNLQITSNPAGAEIFIAGKSRGKAPQLLENLPAGDQVLMLRSDAGTVTATATVVPGETTPLEVKIFAGWILVDAPVEVNLLLNGRAKIGSSMDGQILLPPGPHRVQAVNEGLGIKQWLSVTVEPGAIKRVPFVVQPAMLTLQEEAEVFLDGASVGMTPGTIKIAPGTHEISIRQADGTERRQAMTVRSGQRIEF